MSSLGESYGNVPILAQYSRLTTPEQPHQATTEVHQ